MAYKTYNDVAVYPPHGQFLLHHAAYNEAMRVVAGEQGVDLVDNEALFAGRTEYFIDFVHYSEAGLLKLADDYAGLIAGKHLPLAANPATSQRPPPTVP
jgi:hypothetical protein